MPKKITVEYVKQSVPAFLQRFKEETGYKEHQISDKLRDIDQDKELVDRDDERPQVVQLSKDDLTAEEARNHWDSEEKKGKAKEEVPADDDEVTSGKVMFRQPAKRSGSELDFNVSKKSKHAAKTKSGGERKKRKGVKNTKLLSFNDEDDGT